MAGVLVVDLIVLLCSALLDGWEVLLWSFCTRSFRYPLLHTFPFPQRLFFWLFSFLFLRKESAADGYGERRMRIESLACLVFGWYATLFHDVGWCSGWHGFGFGVALCGAWEGKASWALKCLPLAFGIAPWLLSFFLVGRGRQEGQGEGEGEGEGAGRWEMGYGEEVMNIAYMNTLYETMKFNFFSLFSFLSCF